MPRSPDALLEGLAHLARTAPATPSPHRDALTRLRAGALATIGRGLDLSAAAQTADSSLPVVALAFALQGYERALDHSIQHTINLGVSYLVSPGSPTRATAESLLGLEPGAGGAEVGSLAATLISQFASLPASTPISTDGLVALVMADVAELATRDAAVVPNATEELVRRHLGILLTMLDTLGTAWVVDGARIAIDSPALAQAMRWIASGMLSPAELSVSDPTLVRDGERVVVRADNRVPLHRLRALAEIVRPVVVANALELRLDPQLLARVGARRIMAAVDAALGS